MESLARALRESFGLISVQTFGKRPSRGLALIKGRAHHELLAGVH